MVRSMIIPTNIHSLTEFRQNAKKFVDELQSSGSPLVLTVNGKASLVVENVEVFQAQQNRIYELEKELHKLKEEILRNAIKSGIAQADNHEFSDKSFDEIIAAAHASVTA